MTLLRQPTVDPGLLGGVVLAHALLLAGALFLQWSVRGPQLQAPMVVRLVSSDQARQRTVVAASRVKPVLAPVVDTTGESSRLAPTPKPETVPNAKPTPTAKRLAKAEQDASAPPAPAAVTEPKFDADYLNNPAPQYPPLSRKLREEGRVVLRVQVSPEGTAEAVAVQTSSGFDRLDNAARKAVADWHFVPAQQFDRAVSASVLVPVVFTIRD